MEPILCPEAVNHYKQIEEADRLTRIVSQIELVRTQELMRRFLPEPPAVVLDVGGAAGIHSFWLAKLGYQVHLLDAMPHHIEQAKESAAKQSDTQLASMEVGDARDLQYEDQQVDAVLLFGPLYHLTGQADRLKCLSEAYRVLRPRGILMAVGISRFISMVNCLADGLIEEPNFVSIVERDLQDGQHRNPTDNPEFFTTAFFHHPDELQNEVETAGFRLKDLLAVEGPARLLRDFAMHWQHPQKREWLLELVRNVERERHLFGTSTHLMAIADKQAA